MSADAQLGPLGHAVAGGIGGVIGLFCTYPLDIVKTRMQVGGRCHNSFAGHSTTADASASGAWRFFPCPLDAQVQTKALKRTTDYTGTLDAIEKIVRREGVTGLYSGLNSGLIAQLVQQFVYYYCYETLKPMYQGPSGQELNTFWQVRSRGRGAAACGACV